MKEIKFRAWDKVERKMFYSDDCFFVFEGGKLIERDGDGGWDAQNQVVMLYTGLKDKNGKEIYEGDIVLLRHWKSNDLFDYNKPFVVEWKDGQVNFKQNGFNNFIGSLNGKLTIEVIGNIYENPELMEDE